MKNNNRPTHRAHSSHYSRIAEAISVDCGLLPHRKEKPSKIDLKIETIIWKTCEFEVIFVSTVNVAVFRELTPWGQVMGVPKFRGSFLPCHELTRMQQFSLRLSKGTAPHTGRHQSA